MKPIEFDEQNQIYTRPNSMTEKECKSLPVHEASNQIISCWKGTLLQRIKFLLIGKIWFSVINADGHPPIRLSTETPFEKSSNPDIIFIWAGFLCGLPAIPFNAVQLFTDSENILPLILLLIITPGFLCCSYWLYKYYKRS